MRAMIIQHGSTRRVHSILLDLARDAALDDEPDGTGTINIDGRTVFERVDAAQSVHERVLEAIRTSGNTSPPASDAKPN